MSLVFSPPPNRSYLCPKKARYERFFIYSPNIRCHYPRCPRLRSLHLQDIRSLQGRAQHRPRLHHRQDAVHPLGSRQTNALQHHRRHRVFRPPNRRLIMQAIHIPPPLQNPRLPRTRRHPPLDSLHLPQI